MDPSWDKLLSACLGRSVVCFVKRKAGFGEIRKSQFVPSWLQVVGPLSRVHQFHPAVSMCQNLDWTDWKEKTHIRLNDSNMTQTVQTGRGSQSSINFSHPISSRRPSVLDVLVGRRSFDEIQVNDLSKLQHLDILCDTVRNNEISPTHDLLYKGATGAGLKLSHLCAKSSRAMIRGISWYLRTVMFKFHAEWILINGSSPTIYSVGGNNI